MNDQDEGLLIQFPVWTLVDVAIYQASGIERGLAVFGTDSAGIGPFLPLFTDPDLAARFLETTQMPAMVVVPLRTPEALDAILRLRCATEPELSHVGLDVSFFPGRGPSGRFYPISEILTPPAPGTD